MKFNFHIILLLIANYTLFSQGEKKLLREGNNSYFGGKYKESEKYYGEALKKKPDYSKANYNMGASQYKQGNFADATSQYDVFIKKNNNKDTLSKAFHNLGNAQLRDKKYQDAVNSYKNSLKMNPSDEDTRYNLAYALKKLQEQQKKDQEKKDDKKDDKKEQDQKKDLNNDKKEQEKPQNQMSKEEAQRMLEALKNAEKKLQAKKKIKGDKPPEQNKGGKDW